MSEAIILDCDPGVDDAVAILMTLGGGLDLRALTVTGGNVPLARTVANALRVLELSGRTDIPVHPGAYRPMLRAVGKVSIMHGNDGLGGSSLPEAATCPQDEHAADAIIRLSKDGPVTLCAIGPLTNVALAILKDEGLASRITRIVCMGGAAFCPGNTTPLTEFNFHQDPHAAKIVFESGIPIVMHGLDVTRQATVSAQALNALRNLAPLGTMTSEMLSAYRVKDPCLHDFCAVGYLLRPDLFQSITAHVEILSEGTAAGQTVAIVSARHLGERVPNCQIVTGVDRPALEAMLLATINACEAAL